MAPPRFLPVSSRNRGFARRFVAAGGAVASIFLAALLVACSVNPATGRRQLALIGEAQEVEMGRQADQDIAASLGLYGEEDLQRYVQELGAGLAARSERADLAWQFRVVDDPMVNAFALPGGFIYVTRGILAHLNSEAELASVLGHEIGHVTARHSVEQISKAQLASLGLGVAAIASEDLRPYAGLAEAGVGLLFLKFGRDDERQADDLGLRYLTRGGYDPREMPHVFRTLDRVSSAQGAGRIPSWLSTHPSPADRVERLRQEIAGLPPEAREGKVEREAYLRRLDGLTFGEDPREGFFEGNTFYHPGMAFRLVLPSGWKQQNQKQAVGALAPGQDAAVVLTLAGADSVAEAASSFFGQQGIERGEAWRGGFHHFRTVPAAGAQQQELEGIVGFFAHRGRVFQLRGLSLADRWSSYSGAVSESLASFDALTDRRYLDVEPKRIRVVELPSAMTLEEFARRYPSTVDLEALAIANGVSPGDRLPAGRPVKRVTGGELP